MANDYKEYLNFELLRNHLPNVAAGELAVAAKVEIPVRFMNGAIDAFSAAILTAPHHL